MPAWNSCLRLSSDWENINYNFELFFSNAVVVGQFSFGRRLPKYTAPWQERREVLMETTSILFCSLWTGLADSCALCCRDWKGNCSFCITQKTKYYLKWKAKQTTSAAELRKAINFIVKICRCLLLALSSHIVGWRPSCGIGYRRLGWWWGVSRQPAPVGFKGNLGSQFPWSFWESPAWGHERTLLCEQCFDPNTAGILHGFGEFIVRFPLAALLIQNQIPVSL